MSKSSTGMRMSPFRKRALQRNALAPRLRSQPSGPTGSIDIRPQPGPQEKALTCEADILFYGGAAGGGKTWALLLEPIYHKDVPEFRAVMFRRTMPNITNAGSMWDQSSKLYPFAEAVPNKSSYHWTFKSQARVEFASLQYDASVLDWKSAEVAVMGFDQIEEFTEYQFWYMVSRNRSTCGVKPYIRCTVNPIPEDDAIGGWVHKLVSWWLDEETGLARPERDGVIRWAIRVGDEIQWYESRAVAVEAATKAGMKNPELVPKSITFIAAKLEDNKKLMQADPGYYASLMLLPMVERERLLGANWKIKAKAGNVFNRAWFKIIQVAPADTIWVRYWDKAGTDEADNPAAAYTAGVKMGFSPTTKRYVVGNVDRGRWAEYERETNIKNYAVTDGPYCTTYIEQEPGSGGKESARHTVQNLAGHTAYADRVRGDKYTRARPYASMVQAYNVDLIEGPWNEAYLSELHNYTPDGSGYKDQVDASSGAFNKLTSGLPLDVLSPNMDPDAVKAREDEEKRVANNAAIEHLKQQGCIFPGEW